MNQFFKGILVGIVAGFLIDFGIYGTGGNIHSDFIGQYPDAPRVILTYVTDLPVGGRHVHGIIEEAESYTALHYCGWNMDVYPHPKENEFFNDLCRRMSGLYPSGIKLVPKALPWIPVQNLLTPDPDDPYPVAPWAPRPKGHL